jgi:hypothetical protein
MWQDILKRVEMNTEDFCCAELKREADEFMRDLGEATNDPTLEPKYSIRFQYSGCKQILRHMNFLTSSSNLPEGFKERLVQMINVYEDCKRFPSKIMRG